MSGRRRPTAGAPVWLLPAVVLGVLVGVLVTVGGNGAVTVAVPSAIAVSAVSVAAWTLRRSRINRADYERRLTTWAASEAVLADRLRIARDLHDIVSHGLGLITVRAAAALHVRTAGDDELRAVLSDIETASRQATTELRRMLTVLRASDDDSAPLLPVEGLDQLPDIVAAVERAGLRSRLTLEPMGEVSPGAQIALCRTVREALSNAARHAGPTDVHVHVHRDAAAAVVASITDSGPDGPWRASPGSGHGLTGLRERVSGLGGTLHAHHLDAGFRLTVRIPDGTA